MQDQNRADITKRITAADIRKYLKGAVVSTTIGYAIMTNGFAALDEYNRARCGQAVEERRNDQAREWGESYYLTSPLRKLVEVFKKTNPSRASACFNENGEYMNLTYHQI